MQRELAEYRRQQELWSQEQGALEADASRVTAVNEARLPCVLATARGLVGRESDPAEQVGRLNALPVCGFLRLRLEALKPKSDAEEAGGCRLTIVGPAPVRKSTT